MKREEEQQKNGSWGWLYGITAGACVAAMQIGVGMFQMEQDYAVILGAAQGLLVCSLTVICGSIMEWLLRPLPVQEGELGGHLSPARARVREYEEAFRSLAQSFTGLSAKRAPESEREAELHPEDGAAVLDAPASPTRSGGR